jgi:hypothetical protein
VKAIGIALGFVAGCGRIGFDARDDAPVADSAVAPRCPADPDLVACYAFDGDTLDRSMYANHASGAEVGFVTGVNGSAARFDAATGAILAAKSSSLDLVESFTFDLWVRLDAPPPSAARAMFFDNNNQYGFSAHANELECTGPSNVHFYADAVLPVDTWVHAACTYDGSMMAIYVDGVLLDTLPVTGPNGTGGSTGLQIAANTPDGLNPDHDGLVGALDELRLWRVVTACAVDGSC